ncbi:hypothetical protein SDC9_211547 [bioreactor metagenome]|uniref:Uncharacterized protein n=1 Tax=bioreactor metagenome TaxID=1076179 RepID=A0A645JJN5_9ZZZZ
MIEGTDQFLRQGFSETAVTGGQFPFPDPVMKLRRLPKRVDIGPVDNPRNPFGILGRRPAPAGVTFFPVVRPVDEIPRLWKRDQAVGTYIALQ